MQPSSAKFLEDIREAGQTILEITSGKALAHYVADKILRLAVERCFEIIGEAMRRLDESDRDTGLFYRTFHLHRPSILIT